MTIRIDKEFVKTLKAIAREEEIKYSTLARRWLSERLRKEQTIKK